MSFLTRPTVRATPLSEMARWKRFLAKGDNTWEPSQEKGSQCSGVFKSHPIHGSALGLLPWRSWGPGSARNPQLEASRGRVRGRTAGVWACTLLISIS